MLVSALMPTRDRRELVRLAVEAFRAQTWPCELIAIDDGRQPVLDLLEDLPRWQYLRVSGSASIGRKLNLGCAIARGHVFVRWDDDDWSAPTRIADQLQRLLASGKGVGGYQSMTFWDGRCGRRYLGEENWSLGTALCFTRGFWQQHPFEDISAGEDSLFVQAAQRAGEIVSVDAGPRMVARIHPGNVTHYREAQHWPVVERSAMPPQFPMEDPCWYE
jgi:glycosyltransferase involved in cell wall biosynthesis